MALVAASGMSAALFGAYIFAGGTYYFFHFYWDPAIFAVFAH